MGEEQPRVPVVEETNVRVLYESQASCELEDKSEYPLAGTNSIYSAILSRNEAVKDAKRLKTFLELRDKYVKKKVIFEDPLFPANDSSLFYSQKLPMKIEWKRPSVSAPPSYVHQPTLHLLLKCLFSWACVCMCVSHCFHERGVGLIWLHVSGCIAPGCQLLQWQTADPHILRKHGANCAKSHFSCSESPACFLTS